MKNFLLNFYYSFPIQLLVLHFRKSQILLGLWAILFLTITGNFMKIFGADGLFLAPEYLGTVNPLGCAIVGIAVSIFIMGWNITTFILHSSRFRFLATTSNPFLKYCLNNAIIPLAFLIVYFVRAYQYETNNELIPSSQFLINALGFLGGLFLLVLISFAYFFTADKRIVRTFKPGFLTFDDRKISTRKRRLKRVEPNFGLSVGYYLNSDFKFKIARPVGHYGQSFLDDIFKRHHFAAIITMLMAFIFIVLIAFFLDSKLFQVPAAASISIIFALALAVLGSLSYFLGSWSFLFLIAVYIVLNTLYHYNIIDPRNKAYGLNYFNKDRPEYSLQHLTSLNTPQKIAADKANMIEILNRWKAKQVEEKPLMIFFNFSGGGLRGAGFSMNVLQHLDSVTNGHLMDKTALMSGASGGMLAASYYRELSRLANSNVAINPNDKKYVDKISEDLLNPVFSSMVARDIIAPVQKFSFGPYRYIKDRGYSFEKKFDQNTDGLLNHPIGFFKPYEKNATIPLMILNSVITRDFKKLMICTQPLSFMMQTEYVDSTSPVTGPDAIDFSALFSKEGPMNLSMLTALRMNATYPYILPAVWLPSNPVIDVMDAGLRDNNGQETTLRFLNVFKDWINKNTRGVLIIQIRSRQKGSWDNSYKSGGIDEMITKPFTMMQTNLFMMQDYYQNDEITYAQSFLDSPIHRVAFMYLPEKQQSGAALNFHLTANEKVEVRSSLSRQNNVEAFEQVRKIMKR